MGLNPGMGLNSEWDWIQNGTEPRMGLNPEWDWTPNGTEPRMGLNPEWAWTPNGPELRMDWTPTGLNPEWDSTLNGLNPDWDSTPTETELRMGLNLDFPLNLEYGLHCVKEVYIKRMDFKKRARGWVSVGVEFRVPGLNPDWDSTPPTETELRMGLNLDFPFNPSNMVYNVKVYIVHSTQLSPFYVESRSYSYSYHIAIFSLCMKPLWKAYQTRPLVIVENMKKKPMQLNIVLGPFCVESHSGSSPIRGWVPFGIESHSRLSPIRDWVPF